MKFKQYRKIATNDLVHAVRYVSSDDITKVASLVLNQDAGGMVDISNEHILDVVRPVIKRWRAGVATIEVVNPSTSERFPVELGEWVIRDGRNVYICGEARFQKLFEEKVDVDEVLSEYDVARDTVYNVIGDVLLNETQRQSVAHLVATSMVKDGWVRSQAVKVGRGRI